MRCKRREAVSLIAGMFVSMLGCYSCRPTRASIPVGVTVRDWAPLETIKPWSKVDGGLLMATFAHEDISDTQWRIDCSDLLFAAPTKVDNPMKPGPTFFRDSDSWSNGEALGLLLKNSPLDDKHGLRLAFYVLTWAMDSHIPLRAGLAATLAVKAHRPSADEIRDAIRKFDQNDVEHGENGPRGNLLCSEASLLLLGLSNPGQAGSEMETLSRRALLLSPTIAQTACAHAIKLLEISGQPSRAKPLFATGRKIFEPDNPTKFLFEFWSPTQTPVTRLSSATNYVPKTTWTQFHSLWRWKY
jgi:hypothetical protein